MRPLIIVTGPNKRVRIGWWATRVMLWLVGARAVYLAPGQEALPERAAAIIIGGGDDIEPEHYGLTGDAGATYDPQRDALEMRLARLALDRDIPLLGICRGAQLINVVMGGNLHQDIRPLRRRTPNRNSVIPIKKARITPSSQLEGILQKASVSINSLHNQAVDRIAHGLIVAARDDDGFIQAIENPSSDHFIVGVQWHPEYMPYSAAQRRLFKALIQAAMHYGEKAVRSEKPELEN